MYEKLQDKILDGQCDIMSAGAESKLQKHKHILTIIGRRSTKFQMNLMEDVEQVVKTRFWMDKV